MAARKSCTKLTWGEAKSRTGQVTTGQKKNKEHLRKQDHGALLSAKIIAKQGGNVASSENKKLAKQYRKIEAKSAAIAADRLEEREQKRLAALQEVRPYDRVKEHVSTLLQELKDNGNDGPPPTMADNNEADIDWNDEEIQAKVAECKQMQLDEIMALEAIIPEEDFVLFSASDIEALREKLEQFEADPDDAAVRSSIVKHPPISYTIKLEVDDYRDTTDDPEMDLNAILLLRVTLPPLYLNSEGSQTPIWDFDSYMMVTDKNAFCSADKSLESLAYLDEKGIKDSMNQEAAENLLPYPCVYEIAVTYLSENIFSYLTMQSYLLATTK